MDKILDGKKVAAIIKEQLKQEINLYTKKPTLAVIQVGNDQASNIYVAAKKKLCEELNIKFNHFHFITATQEELIKQIQQLNADANINAILVQMPLPKNIDYRKIINAIDYQKDVDGLTNINMIKLLNNEEGIISCTALGILKIMEYYNINISSKNIAILGRSRLVGLPTSILMLNNNATVTICHSKTKNLDKLLKSSDIIISAVGKKHIITKDMVKNNVIIIDVGITREDKLYGDVSYDEVYTKCQLITPVPGGIGPMTVIMLMNNILKCYKIQTNSNL